MVVETEVIDGSGAAAVLLPSSAVAGGAARGVAVQLGQVAQMSNAAILKLRGPSSGRSSFVRFALARKIGRHQSVLLLKHFEYRRTLGYVGLVCSENMLH